MDPPSAVRVVADVALEPNAAFAQIVDELVEALARAGLRFDPGPEGTVRAAEVEVAHVRTWNPGHGLLLDWDLAPWAPGPRLEVEFRFQASGHGCRVEVEQRGAERRFDGDPVEWTGWVASAVVVPFLRAIAPSGYGDWLTDRRARRPSGPGARATYADPVFHRPNFRMLLDTLRPGPTDRVLEVGCGGGAFLAELLGRGVTAVGIDHSPEMVHLARASNRGAIDAGRLEVIEAEGSQLPVPDGTFTIALSTGVFGFLPRPLETLREMHRALAPGGRLAVFDGTKELAGTPACPEPLASRMHFFEDDELAGLARAAGFVSVEVTHPPLGKYAEEAGVPTEALELFRGTVGSQFLLGVRP
ncbi:MAG: methyltransferase domain-containing protein [Thermoplasmata archaeon]|nr:methyltransferase domain-containing protein [Thermoplasmata archaeon]